MKVQHIVTHLILGGISMAKVKKVITGVFVATMIIMATLCATVSAAPALLRAGEQYYVDTYSFTSTYSHPNKHLLATLVSTNHATSRMETLGHDNVTAYVCIWNASGNVKVDNKSAVNGLISATVNPIAFTPVKSHHEGSSTVYNEVDAVLCN